MGRKNGVHGDAVKYQVNDMDTSQEVHMDDVSFSDGSDVNDINNGKKNSSSKGPWANSLQNYSRSVNRPELENTNKQNKRSRQFVIFGVICVIVFAVGLGLGIVVGKFALKESSEPTVDHLPPDMIIQDQISTTTKPLTMPTCSCLTSPVTCTVCESRDPDLSSGNEVSESVFAALTVDEINKVQLVLRNRGLTTLGTSLNSNRASHIYLNPVNKREALAYLDSGGPFPGRYARVHVIRGVEEDVMEYKVGPLHETIENIGATKLINDGQIHINRRPYDGQEISLIRRLVASEFSKLNSIFSESFGGATLGKGVYYSVVSLPTEDVNDRVSLAYLYLQNHQIQTMRILPVTCLIHHPGIVQSNWNISDFFYLSQGPFATAEELLDGYNNLRKFQFPSNYLQNIADYSLKLNTSMPLRTGSNTPPPRTFEPSGPRYTVKGNRVSWLGWEFEFSSDPQRGPAIFDVRFKGERIAYEISLQDVTLIYASQSNGAGPPVLTDTHFQLGSYSIPRKGIDCPKRANYLKSSNFFYGQVKTIAGTCVFETDGEIPLWRHGSGGLADHYLVIRSPMDLGNYDYSLQWMFHLDGHIETQISASGYLYGAFWDPGDPLVNQFKSSTPFGYRISDYLLGPIHDHSFSFKVDLDILGLENSMETLHWKGGSPLEALRTQTNITAAPSYYYLNTTRYIQYDLIEKERGYSLDPANPKYWTIVNENERNVWGVKRGYRIIPHSTSAEHLLDHVMFKAWGHLQHNIAVTKRKDSEPYATDSLYDLSQPGQSFRGVGKMLDNENIRNEDLVLWVTEKFLHAPSSEDVPMTIQIHKGFSLKPYNYFDRTPTFDVPGHYDTQEPYLLTPCLENF